MNGITIIPGRVFTRFSEIALQRANTAFSSKFDSSAYTDGYYLRWDESQNKFVGATISSAHSALSGLDYASAGHTGFAGTGVDNTFTGLNTFANGSSIVYGNTDPGLGGTVSGSVVIAGGNRLNLGGFSKYNFPTPVLTLQARGQDSGIAVPTDSNNTSSSPPQVVLQINMTTSFRGWNNGAAISFGANGTAGRAQIIGSHDTANSSAGYLKFRCTDVSGAFSDIYPLAVHGSGTVVNQNYGYLGGPAACSLNIGPTQTLDAGPNLLIIGAASQTTNLIQAVSSTSTVQFAVGATGQIKTNQSATGSSLGTVVKKLPIYDESGTLLGYAPLYNSIS